MVPEREPAKRMIIPPPRVDGFCFAPEIDIIPGLRYNRARARIRRSVQKGGGLLEALNGSLTRVVDVKDQRELGDDENIIDVLVDAAQLDLPALAGI